nr:PREDICTED: uncharacterized protein LOC103544256 isoform X1 [Equus przewalskii]XP_008509318.1 PREDICTED: uncharacterized protein LOC103544256 isoform X1 [Equus przewalskii]XP_008509319.1 PREDICTED: uncharacterized protein LOC103544256 isoform X1 [Equus przewalskii]
MMFDRCCQRERLYKTLYIVHIFILAGAVYYYFLGSVRKTAPDHEIVGESSQPIGKTLRPVWGLMDKCYPVTTQRRRVKSGKKQASEAMTPKAMGGLNDAAPKEETDILSQDEGEESKKIRKEMAVHPAGKRGPQVPPSLISVTLQRSQIAQPLSDPPAPEREGKTPGGQMHPLS